MAGLSQLSSTLQTTFATLSVRERRMLTVAGIALAVFVVFLVVVGFSSKAEAIKKHTLAKAQKLEEVQSLAAGYRDAKAASEALERQLQASNVRLMSFVEEKGQKAGLEIPSINPRADLTLEGTKIVESAVEVSLMDVKLNRLLDFLAAVEAGPGIVKVKHLWLEPKVPTETVNARLTIATYHLK